MKYNNMITKQLINLHKEDLSYLPDENAADENADENAEKMTICNSCQQEIPVSWIDGYGCMSQGCQY